jgi:L-fucose isomerase-like protein
MDAVDKVGLRALGSSLHGNEGITALKEKVIAGLNASGKVLVEEATGAGGDLALQGLLILTGGVEEEALEAAALLEEPILIVAHPWHNSLPAALELLARLRQEGRQGLILYGEAEQVASQLALHARVQAAWREFVHSRVGLVGRPSDWLVASGVEPARLRELGLELVELELGEVLARVRALEGRSFAKEAEELERGASRLGELDRETIEGAIRIYHALRGLAEEHRLSALTVRCFDLIGPLRNTGCYALARLNDEGLTAGCEGDLQALLSMHLARLLTGQAAFMGNLARVERAGLLLAHCTCPLSLGSSCSQEHAIAFELRSHFESSLGLGLAARLPSARATVFRIGGEGFDQLFLAEGSILPHEPEEGLCRTQVALELDRPELIDELLTCPLGNHLVLILGEHRALLEALFQTYLRR